MLPYEVEIPESTRQKRRGPRSGYMAGNPLQKHREPTQEQLFKQVGLEADGHASLVRARAPFPSPGPIRNPEMHLARRGGTSSDHVQMVAVCRYNLDTPAQLVSVHSAEGRGACGCADPDRV
jgi:hypothetical protein